MCDAAGELADGVELLRLLQEPLGLMRIGNVVIDYRSAANAAVGIAQRPTADHQPELRPAIGRLHHHLLAVELLAAQRARDRQCGIGNRRRAIALVEVVLRLHLTEGLARPAAQELRDGLVRDDDPAVGLDHKHAFSHAVERVLQDLGGMPQILIGCDQMILLLQRAGFERACLGFGTAQREAQRAIGDVGATDQIGRNQKNEHYAGEIGDQQLRAGRPRCCGARGQLSLLLPSEFGEAL